MEGKLRLCHRDILHSCSMRPHPSSRAGTFFNLLTHTLTLSMTTDGALLTCGTWPGQVPGQARSSTC
eukprot:805639-Pelagomonas_calceolata.AAC.4